MTEYRIYVWELIEITEVSILGLQEFEFCYKIQISAVETELKCFQNNQTYSDVCSELLHNTNKILFATLKRRNKHNLKLQMFPLQIFVDNFMRQATVNFHTGQHSPALS